MEYFVSIKKIVLSSEWMIVKTERFVKETSRFDGVDKVISALVGNLCLYNDSFAKSVFKVSENISKDTYRIVINKEHYFYFCVTLPKGESFNKQIIFYRYEGDDNIKRVNDQSLIAHFLKDKAVVSVENVSDIIFEKDFLKLYKLSNNTVNFPLLSREQKDLVTIEDQNVLVQGVAGSGKTNICIDKIVYAACRGYTGKVLYTTFSRGLLVDTKEKVDVFIDNLKKFLTDFEQGNIIFGDKHHKKAIENYIGINLPVTDENIGSLVQAVIDYLENKVDYYLIEDIYKNYIKSDIKIADEGYFTKIYINNIKNHQLVSRLPKIRHLSSEIIYKEIFGLIYGTATDTGMLDKNDYLSLRKDSFSYQEGEIIYQLAKDYGDFLVRKGLVDNNLMSKQLLSRIDKIDKYSLAILDEVQDLTEINLQFFKAVTIKLFCVGDALQMINPSYFSFASLKRILYVKDIVSVATLKHNYRNTEKIAKIIDKLGEINIKQFGTHSFVLKTECVDSEVATSAVYVKGKEFIDALKGVGYENCTIIVSDNRTKELLRSKLKSQEILTVSEIKGLERETVILVNILSNNADKWESFNRMKIARKEADENSVFRYYFNLFYVGLSRAKSNIYVAEEKEIDIFKDFLTDNFDQKTSEEALASINSVANKIEVDQQEILDRIKQFLKLEQYENAKFTTNKVLDDKLRQEWLQRIAIEEEFVHQGEYREAGIRAWEYGMTNDAKRYFKLSKDESLIDLMIACEEGEGNIGVDIIRYLPSVEGKPVAEKLILDILQKDLQSIKANQKTINNKLKQFKEIKNG